MKGEKLILVVVLIFFLLVISGCTEEIEKFKNGIGLNVISGSVTSCTNDEECQKGYICENGACKLGCLTDVDCQGGICDIDTGRCIEKGECIQDSECSSGRCDLANQKCVECLAQIDCGEDMVCNLETYKCEEYQEISSQEPQQPTKIEPKEPLPDVTFDLEEGDEKAIKLAQGLVDEVVIKLTHAVYENTENVRYEIKGVTYGLVPLGYVSLASWWQLKDATIRIQPVYREGKTVTFNIKECKSVEDPNCFDGCKDFQYKDNKFTGGRLLTWSGSNQKACDYRLEKIKKIEFYQDKDGDGYGNNNVKQTAEKLQEGYVENMGDCDDENYKINPKAEEICDNLDNDCNGEIDENEECKKPACIDPDGDNTQEATKVLYKDKEGNELQFEDRCVGIVGLLEGMCNEEGKFACYDENNCRRRCLEGQICENGACKESTAQCTDQDRLNIKEAGQVIVKHGGETETIGDRCLGERFIEEAYCSSINTGKTKIMGCEKDEVCIGGACKPSKASCQDSDGKERKTKGTTAYTETTGEKRTHADYCEDSQVVEGICKLGTFIKRKVQCPQDTTCENGACIKSEQQRPDWQCNDPDGFDVHKKSTMTYWNGLRTIEATDFCQSEYKLNEYYCQEGYYPVLRFWVCDRGKCVDGACTQPKSGKWW